MSVETQFATSTREQQQGPTPQQVLMQATTGHVISSAVYVAAKLKIADLLAKGPKPVADLAQSTNTNEDALYRTLRVLAGVGIFTESSDRVFALTPAADGLLSNDENSMLPAVTYLSDPFHFSFYAELMYSVRTGKPSLDHIYKMPWFELFAQKEQEEESRVFNDAMTSITAMSVPAVLETYDFSGIGTLMDVAGGHGFLLCSILKRHPKMKGILVEMEHVAPGAEQRICDDKLQERSKVVVADFFKGLPEGADAIVMKHIIHDWDDTRAIALLKNCHAALPKSGKVILLEAVVPEGDAPSFSKILDLEMLTATGGLERTEKQYRKLFEDAGFRLTRMLQTKSPLNVVEAVKS